jgi:haloalkane dehalogenase
MGLVIERASNEAINRPDFPYRGQFLQVDGGKMHYIDEGSGDPIVFVHGTPTWSYLWRNVIRDLRSEYRCLAMDNIGFGRSDKPENWSYSSFCHARNLKLLIDEKELTGVTLVLHGMGGPIGLQYALDNVSNVRRIIVMNSWAWNLKGDPTAERVWKIAAGPLGFMLFFNINAAKKLMRSFFADKSKFTAAIEEAYTGPFEDKDDRHGLHKQIRQVLEGGPLYDEIWSRHEELKGIPMQFIWGMADQTFGERALNRFWREFPTSEVVRFPGCGHFVPEERPVETLKAIREFLVSTRGNAYLA